MCDCDLVPWEGGTGSCKYLTSQSTYSHPAGVLLFFIRRLDHASKSSFHNVNCACGKKYYFVVILNYTNHSPSLVFENYSEIKGMIGFKSLKIPLTVFLGI